MGVIFRESLSLHGLNEISGLSEAHSTYGNVTWGGWEGACVRACEHVCMCVFTCFMSPTLVLFFISLAAVSSGPLADIEHIVNIV